MGSEFPFRLPWLLARAKKEQLKALAKERERWFLITRSEFVAICGQKIGKKLADKAHAYRQENTNTWCDPLDFYGGSHSPTDPHYQSLLRQSDRVRYLDQ